MKSRKAVSYLIVKTTLIITGLLLSSSFYAQSLRVHASSERMNFSLHEKHVLIVNGFQYGLPVADINTRSIVDTLVASGMPVGNIYVEYLDLSRKNSQAQRLHMQTMFAEKSQNHSIDLIITIDQVATDFIVNECQDLFVGVPLIIPYNEVPVWQGPSRKLMIAAASNDAEGTVQHAFKLFPETENVVVIKGLSDVNAPFVDRLLTAIDNLNYSVNIEKTTTLPFDEMLAYVSALPPNTIAFYGSYFQDINNDVFVPSVVANRVSNVANVPVFAFIDMHIKSGLLGGSVVINEKFAQKIALVALDYLTGALHLTDEPFIVTPDFELLFDYQDLERFGAEMHVLPDDTVFLNYMPSIWVLYREYIILMVLFIIVLLMFITMLVLNRELKINLGKLQQSELALRENRDRLSNIITGTQVGTWEIDVQSNQLTINERWADIVGYTIEELMPCTQDTWYQLVEPNDLSKADALFKKVVQGGSDFFDSQYRMRHKNGKWVWVLSRGKILKSSSDGKPLMMSGTHADITELKELEEKIVESRRMYQSVVDTQQEMVSRFLPDTTLTFVNDAFCRAFGKKRTELLGVKFLLFLPTESHDLVNTQIQHLTPEQPIAVSEYEVALPDNTIRWHERTDIALFNDLGEMIEIQSVGRDITRSKQAEDNLIRAYDATIEGWARALDLKDEETEHHSQRVLELTLRIATKLGIEDVELANMRRGALLHDIGKMGIPDHILQKPGKLSEDEWKIMIKHPVYAYNMLSPITYLNLALDIPYCHHEKWDGSGYPNGLRGEQIPLAARIFAVVDVYDALISDRPYRKAWSKEKAIDYIKEQAGIHFDPKIVEVFLREVQSGL